METDQDRKEIDPATKVGGVDASDTLTPNPPHPNPLPGMGEGAAAKPPLPQQTPADLKPLSRSRERMPDRAGEGGSSGDTLLSSILLLQKNAPSPLSVQRATAGAVLEAAMAVSTPSLAETIAQQASVSAESAALHETSGRKAPEGASIHTYKGDIERSVRGRGLSVSDMISSQGRRADTSESFGEARASGSLSRVLAGMGILLVTCGLAAGVWWVRGQLSATAPAAGVSVPSAFIRVDSVKVITIPSDYTPTDVLRLFTQNRDTLGLSLGLVARLVPVREGTTTPMTAQDLFALMDQNVSGELSRAVSSQFLLGVHSFQDNQAFLIFHTETYAQAYAGMLAWERTMRTDLSPLFDRGISPTLPVSDSAAALPAQVLTTAFVDRTVENHDARVLQDAQGNILLLWTFLDRNTLVITTNEYTLRELITRLAGAPVVPTVGQ